MHTRGFLTRIAVLYFIQTYRIKINSFQMSLPGDGLAAKLPGRFKLMRAFAVALMICLIFYTVTLSNVDIRSSVQTWNFSAIVKCAASKFQSVTERPNVSRETKLVLLWNDFFTKSDWLPSTLDLHCPVTECDTTSNRSMLANSSVVILHWRNTDTDHLPQCDPSETVHCPPWALFNKEAPPHTSKSILQAIEGRVLWTVSYRRDSDIFAPYGQVVARKSSDYSEPVLDPDKRLVCWLVSNCDTPSKREVFVSELEDYIEVDMYGRCGNMQCPHKLVIDCYRWMSSRCLFYLSLENSFCKDYITEKLYYALTTDMVPIVMGNERSYRHLPPHSFINAADFSSPKELAEYLVKVGRDKKLYQPYLSWKRDYEVKDYSYRWYCDLCKKLHNIEVEDLKPRKNLVSWWFNQSECASWHNL